MSITNTITRAANMAVLQLRKHAPEILTATALTSGGVALGLTVKQTLTVEPILEPWKEWRKELKDGLEKKKYIEEHPEEDLPPFPEETARKITLQIGAQTAIKLAKHYALPLAFAGLSAASMLGMYKVWSTRYAAVVAVATGLQETLKRYRETVRTELGEDLDKALMTGATDKARETSVDEQTRKPVRKVQKASQYARIFDESSIYYKRAAGENLGFLQKEQAIMNRMLAVNGCVFLNEVYDALGFPRTKAGSVVGWLYDPDVKDKIDFGFWDLSDETKRAFINGWEKSVLLDFNVDGIIYDKI